jgi:outer membrane protein TolC
VTRCLVAMMVAISLGFAEDLQLDPEEAAQRAVAYSADLIAAAQDEIAVSAAQEGAWAFALPQVYARAGADRRYPLDPRSSPGFSSGLGIEQHVYTPGRWDAVAATGQARRDAARADLESVRRDAALRARLAVERVRLAKARLAVLTDRRAQREEEQADAEALFAAGRTTVTESRQSAVATAQAQDAVLAGQADLAAARRELAAAIEATDPVDARGSLVRPTGLPALLEQARTRRGPEQRALEARRRAEIGSAEQREAGSRPQVFVSADTSTGGDRYDKTYGNWGFGAGVRWSLYDGGSRSADAEAARAREAALSARARVSERERERVLATLGDEIPIIAGRLALAETTMAAALENYTDARERFRVGRLKLIDVGQAGLAVQESGLVQANLIAREAEIAHRLRAMAE